MRIILLTIFLCLSTPVFATTYYVGIGGTGTNCTQAQVSTTRHNTIAEGIACLVAGDTLIIGAGTYTEAIYNSVPSGISSSQPTIVQAESGATVIISGVGAGGYVIELTRKNYITFDGITCDGSNAPLSCFVAGGSDSSDTIGSTYITFQNGTLRNTLNFTGMSTRGADNATNTNWTIRNNHFHDIGTTLPITNDEPTGHGLYLGHGASNWLIEGNIFENIGTAQTAIPNRGYAIHIFTNSGTGADDNIIRNNFIRNSGQGILCSSGSNNLIYNNVISGLVGRAGLRAWSGGDGCQFLFNTIYSGAEYGIVLESGPTGTVVKNNIAFNNGTADISDSGTGTVASNNLTTDPSFVCGLNCATNPDFHLFETSDAIGAGTPIAFVLIDFDNVTRNITTPTIGAFEAPSGVDPGSDVSEDFESYTATTSIDCLNGGTGWTQCWQLDAGTATVENASCLTGKAFQSSAVVSTQARRFFTAKSGDFTFQLRMCLNITNPNDFIQIALIDQSGQNQITVAFGDTNIIYAAGAASGTLVAGYSADTSYRFRFNFDTVNHLSQVRIATNDAEYSGWLNTYGSFTSIAGLYVNNYATNAHVFEIDDINDDEGPPELPPAPVSLIGTRTRIRMR